VIAGLRTRGVRLSLTVWYTGAVLVVLTSYALVVFAFVSRNLSRALDDQLRADFQWAAAMADLQPDGTLKWFDEDVDGETDSPWLRVSSNGRLIFRTAIADRNALPMADGLIDHPDGRIVAVTTPRSRARILTGRSNIYSKSVVLQVARSEAPMYTQLNELALLLGLGLPLGVLMAGAGGYFLARKALAPVERMANRAAVITAEKLSDRLPVVNPHDELGRLATVFNETLGRLESSFGQMRQFTADVSHELRTPLTAVKLVGEVGLRDARDLEASRRVIGSMLEDVDRLCTLVDRLLTLSRAQAGEKALSQEAIELAELVEDVVKELSVLAEDKEQELTLEVQACPTTILCDPSLLRQSVTNVIDNAIKYTPAGGRIQVLVSREGDQALLEVRDTGPGIPSHMIGRVFDRYCRVEEWLPSHEGQGSGLGLAIAKWAVEANGGMIHATSSRDGSAFRITLPLALQSKRKMAS
jgi:heavy metal sensor kinase